MRRRPSNRPIESAHDPLWFKDAILYELRVRSFFDANGDGIGDFQGVAEKLDYLQDLGVTTLWLLPFYPSPCRDDGYDIADYHDVHPEVGTLDDFKLFLERAHERGLRVVTELVLNHTSDQHPWFQRARRAPQGSSERDFYVWSDTAERYKDARIIFKDFEHSNWTWDPVARAYFWHRFYSHQPDLNFENPEVHKALLEVVDFWFGLGVDGLRLDAVPYLYEKEGTNCENLAETHAFLRKLRKHVDDKFEGRMLLAEANQWPEDSVAYFGEGDECHMAFHFPIMPRIFMSIHMEDRFPITDILAQTPAIPENCQWAIFLRNHDELTLEMVTDEERDYMYRAYADDPTMRINLGIRRRLAPLAGGDRRNMELMNALLLSLPGTPVLYYGDEIGMGDNVFLGDRNGVRTPMQWSADRNAGFSRVNPQRLISPVIIDPEYHYESVNVEFQQNNPSSLLWWMKRMIALRKRFAAFGRGTIEFLQPDNPRVLAFVRQHGDEAVLVVANLSRFVQCAQIDLSKHKGLMPVEALGQTKLPVIGDAPYVFTLGAHGFYWLSLERPKSAELDARAAGYQPPTIELRDGVEGLLRGQDRPYLAEALTSWIETRQWFSRDGRTVASARVVDAIRIAEGEVALDLVIVALEYAAGHPERWMVPIGVATGERLEDVRRRAPNAIIAHVRPAKTDAPTLGVFDVVADPELCRTLLDATTRGGRLKGVTGELVGGLFGEVRMPEGTPDVRVIRPDSAEPILVFGDALALRLLRRVEDGANPDLEMGRALAQRATPANVARVVGALELRPPRGEASTLVILKEYVPNEGDAWANARAELGRYYERVLTRADLVPPRAAHGSFLALAEEEVPAAARETIGPYLDRARLLGRRTAELHYSLSAAADLPAFAPESYTAMDQRSRYQSMRNLCGKAMRALRSGLSTIPRAGALDADVLLRSENQILDWFEELLERRLTAPRTRYHGDFHLGRLLYTGKDFVVLDLDGDRRRTLEDRRRKRSPLQDVAGMLRSLHYAAFTAVLGEGIVRPEDRVTAEPWADAWTTWTGAAFVGGYLEVARDAPFLPSDLRERALLLDTFVLEAALTQLAHEIATCSERVVIPLRAIRQMLELRSPDAE